MSEGDQDRRVVIFSPEQDFGWRVQLEVEGEVKEYHDLAFGTKIPAAFALAAEKFPEVPLFVPQGSYEPGLTPERDAENLFAAASRRPADRGEG